jgi:hypothetical protein
MNIGQIKDLTQRIDDALSNLTLPRKGGTLYEHYDDGTTVKWHFENVASPQDVSHRVEEAAIWMWSLKDHLKHRIAATGGTAADVEVYVNSCRYLPVCADIANGAKHGRLRNSRSGRFAALDGAVMRSHGGMIGRIGRAAGAHVRVKFDKPSTVSYRVPVRATGGRYIGDALVILRRAWDEWLRFIRRRAELKLAMPYRKT